MNSDSIKIFDELREEIKLAEQGYGGFEVVYEKVNEIEKAVKEEKFFKTLLVAYDERCATISSLENKIKELKSQK